MKTLKKYFERRTAIEKLSRMTDRQLEDIGIPRYDIKRVITSGK